MTLTLTANELAVLRAIDKSEFGDSLTDGIWFFSVADNMQADGPKGLALSGTISSMVQKRLVTVGGKGNDAFIQITQVGLAAYVAAVGFDNVAKPI